MKYFILLLFVWTAFSCGNNETEIQAIEKISGKKIFAANCTTCHGDNGRLGAMGSNDLTTSSLPLAEVKDRVINGKGRMLPYKNILSVEEIDAVSEYVMTLRQ
jgi:mono/diheme cytochrome c family protein